LTVNLVPVHVKEWFGSAIEAEARSDDDCGLGDKI